jgi:uncharacterized protein DUF29
MPGSPAQLYDKDFVRWTEEQAAALRETAGLGINLPLDWENLAEEIDSLGRSQSRELGSRIAVVVEHLIKLETSPAADPRPGWIDTIGRERRDIENLLNDSPSLRPNVAGLIEREMPRTIRLVARSLRNHGETNPETIAMVEKANYTEDQVLGDWFPGDPLPAGGERE